MDILPSVEVTGGALSAEKVRLDIIAQNIANAQTTRGPDGLPYQRRIVSFETELASAADGSNSITGVKVGSITVDPTLGPLVHNPSHPHADANGMVRMPNVNTTREMVDLITASRAYEANLSVVRTARQLAEQALRIGR
jgi:flagellar basal-body rod protein FlgC